MKERGRRARHGIVGGRWEHAGHDMLLRGLSVVLCAGLKIRRSTASRTQTDPLWHLERRANAR